MKPQIFYLMVEKYILWYIASLLDYSIFYTTKSPIIISDYIDIEWIRDLTNRRSIISFIFELGTSPITWLSKKQPTITFFSSKVEYMEFSIIIRESVWLKKFTNDFRLKMPKPISIYCDDERSIKIATNPNINLRTKYIVTYYHFIKERIEIEETRLIYMPSLEQVANIFIKSFGHGLFLKIRTRLNTISIKEAKN